MTPNGINLKLYAEFFFFSNHHLPSRSIVSSVSVFKYWEVRYLLLLLFTGQELIHKFVSTL